jgi:superfamily II DNA or RNA helicase
MLIHVSGNCPTETAERVPDFNPVHQPWEDHHMKKTNFHRIYDRQYTSWGGLESAIEGIADTTEKGGAFEQFVFLYLQFHRDLYEIETVFMREDIPDQVKRFLRLEKTDYGVDGVIIRKDGMMATYQAKFRTNRLPPSYRELATFWAESQHADLCYIFANCAKLPELAHKNHKQQPVVLVDAFIGLDAGFFENIYRYVHDIPTIEKVKFQPRPYQQKMIDEVVDGFRQHDRGKLIAACGTGKTATALWIKEAMHAKTTLFVAPSLSLVKQTLEGWVEQAAHPFKFLCVCSDRTVAAELDESEDAYELDIGNLNIPVTTDPEVINQFLDRQDDSPKIVFSTYQSLDAIVFALMNLKQPFAFDLGIFDEAHRTAGAKNSQMFIYAHKDAYIPIKKRLFMTATERIVTPRIKSMAESAGQTVFSMDDPDQYGPTLTRLNFGEAIREGIIADYRVVICAVEEEEIFNLIRKSNLYLSTDVEGDAALTTSDGLFKQVLLAKAVEQLGVKKVITFHGSVKSAKIFIEGSSDQVPLSTVFDRTIASIGDHEIYFSHINGSMSAGERKQMLKDFREKPYGVISNARCLTEGVDVPVIDAIYFAEPKNSTIDIVQAVGRALRKNHPDENKIAYIIIPVVLPTNTLNFSGVNADLFDTLHAVIQALRDQDQQLADVIDELNLQTAKGKKPSSPELEKKIVVLPSDRLQIEELHETILLRIAEVNSQSAVFKSVMKQALMGSDRKGSVERVFKSIGDYNVDAYKTSLVLPTLSLFHEDNEIKAASELTVNHNNVSHSERIGAIDRISKTQYRLTPIGRLLRANPDAFDVVFREQMLKYYIENKSDGTYLFPYRALFKVFLAFDSMSKLEFLYCLYASRSTTDAAIDQAIGRIHYLRETYPKVDILNEENQAKVLELINDKFNVAFSYKDVWTSRTTTYNQFNYFKKHLWAFSDIFEPDLKAKDVIKVYPGSRAAIREWLERTQEVEAIALRGSSEDLRRYYTKLVIR